MHNAEQEEAALVGMAVHGVSIPGAWSSLRSEHFVGPVAPVKVPGGVVPARAHARVWRLLDESRTGDRLEPAEVLSLLMGAGADVVGPLSYWTALPGQVLNTEPLCARVLEAASRRSAATALEALQKAVSQAQLPMADCLSMWDDLRATLTADEAGQDSHWVNGLDALHEEVAEIERRKEAHALGQAVGFSTPWRGLNDLIGPLIPDLYVVFGPTGTGKTFFAQDLVRWVCRAGGKVPQFSLEMRAPQLMQRELTGPSVGSRALRAGDLSRRQLQAVYDKSEQIAGWAGNWYIDPRPMATKAQIFAAMRDFKRRHGAPDLIVIDHLHIADHEHDNPTTGVGRLANAFAGLAGLYGCPVLLLAQMSRKWETRADKRPIKTDCKDASAIEQAAAYMIGLYRPAAIDPHNCPPDQADYGEFCVVKGRYGGEANVPVKWDLQSGGWVNDAVVV